MNIWTHAKMTETASSVSAQLPQASRSWPRLLLGLIAGALVGMCLAWFAAETRAAEEQEAADAPIGTGELVNLGIEVLALVRTLFRLLKRM